jgi:hypothetical protein
VLKIKIGKNKKRIDFAKKQRKVAIFDQKSGLKKKIQIILQNEKVNHYTPERHPDSLFAARMGRETADVHFAPS